MLILVLALEALPGDGASVSSASLDLVPDVLEVGAREVVVATAVLPRSSSELPGRAGELIDELRPDAVVVLGATTRQSVTLWRGATGPERRKPLVGESPSSVPRLRDGARGRIHTTVPVEDLVERLGTMGVSATTGATVGSPLDHALHRAALMSVSRPASSFEPVPVALIGLPDSMGESAADGGAMIRAVIEAMASAVVFRDRSDRADVIIRGGATARLLRPMTLPTSRAPRIGVSGGVGAGKSTVTATLRRHGAIIADADELAHRVVEPGTEGLTRVVEAFGPGVLLPDGSLDRGALGRIVFADVRARARLESITHPLIARAARDIMRSAPSNSLAIYDVPLLVETGMEDLFDAVIMVDAPRRLRLTRLEDRGMPVEEAERRMAAQASTIERRRAATIWIDNAGTRDDLAILVDVLIARWFLREG